MSHGFNSTGSNISKTSASVSPGYPNTRNLIVFECLETSVKHEARVFEMASQSAPNYKQRMLFSLTFSFCILLFN